MNQRIKVKYILTDFHSFKKTYDYLIYFVDESEATTSFLMQLSSWDKEELDDKLANRVQVSKRAVSKVVQAFDRLSQRNEKITLALKGEFDGGNIFPHYIWLIKVYKLL